MSSFLREQIRRSFSNAANSYELAALHQKNIAEQLVEVFQEFYNKDFVNLRVLDVGSGTGFVSDACFRKKLFSSMINVDISEAMLKQDEHFTSLKIKLCADAHQLPFQNESIDLCFSSYAFQWSNNELTLLKEMFRVLKPSGMLFFSIPGPNTFYELKRAWAEVDNAVHVHDFMCDKALFTTAFACDFKPLHFSQKQDVLEYPDQQSALLHIKKIGASNLHKNRNKNLLGKQNYLDFSAAFRKHSQALRDYSLSYESYFFGFLKPSVAKHHD